MPPTDVQLVYSDGMRVPVDCLYVGWDKGRSLHVWRVIAPRHELPVDTKIAVMPNRCAVEIVVEDPTPPRGDHGE